MKKCALLLMWFFTVLMISTSAYPLSESTNDAANMQIILARTEALEKEIRDLKSQLRAMKVKQANRKKAVHVNRSQVTTKHPNVETRSPYLGGTPVVISPFLGLRSEFDDNDLIVHISDINTDLRLLKQRQKLYKQRAEAGFLVPTKPQDIILELSGLAEAQTFLKDPEHGKTRGDIDLATAELDVAAQINQWANGFIAMNYDNSATAPRRVSNSRFFLDRGFITIGNLNATPLYGTVGQFFVPFGQYDSHMLSATLPQSLGKTKARAILLGYQELNPQPFNGSVYVYHGDTRQGQNSQYGVSLEKNVLFNDVDSTWGVGYTSHIAESTGMQRTGNSGFAGFGDTSATERLSHRIPAIDAHGSLKIGKYDFIAEYLSAVRRFDHHDLTFNDHGARPQALNAEANYNFSVAEIPTSFAVGYGLTRDALALGLPKQRYLATLNAVFWEGTIESLEFRHDINYGRGSYAAGRAGDVGALAATSGSGRTSNMLTAQIGVYF